MTKRREKTTRSRGEPTRRKKETTKRRGGRPRGEKRQPRGEGRRPTGDERRPREEGRRPKEETTKRRDDQKERRPRGETTKRRGWVVCSLCYTCVFGYMSLLTLVFCPFQQNILFFILFKNQIKITCNFDYPVSRSSLYCTDNCVRQYVMEYVFRLTCNASESRSGLLI